MKNYTSGNSNPEVFITKGRQRVKQFDRNVYLNDGDNFEIEIFNPTTNHILAEISLDGKQISYGGLVLRPGERVFLERFIDSNNKFIYSTYVVDGNNPAVDNAIRNNGGIKVDFFNERAKPVFHNTLYRDPYFGGTANYGSTSGYGGTNTTFASSGIPFTETNMSHTNGTSTASAFYSAPIDTLSFSGQMSQSKATLDSVTEFKDDFKSFSQKETGTIEKGDTSSQYFTTTNMDFLSYSFHTSEWKILPKSQQKITAKDIKRYCTECGTKQKDKFIFCPKCGTKFE